MTSPLTVVLYLAACTGLVFLPLQETGYDRYHLPKELWLAAGALAAVLVTWKRRWPADAITWLMVAMVAVGALSTALSVNPALGLRQLALIGSAALLLSAARTCNPQEAEAARAAVVIAAACIALVALLESSGVIVGLSGAGRAPGATLGQRNAVAHTLLIASPAAWTIAARAHTRAERVLGLMATMLLGAGIVVTRTRAAWLMVPVALAVWVWLSPERRRLAPAAAALLAAAAIALVAPTALKWSSATPYRETATRLFDTSSGSGAGRLIQYRATLELWAEHPIIGVGPGNWMVHYPTVSPPGDPTFRTTGWLHTGRLANSDWLALLCECGTLGAALALAWVVAVGRAARGDAQTVAVLIATLGVGALDSVVQLPAAAAYAALLLGLGIKHGTGSTRPVQSATEAPVVDTPPSSSAVSRPGAGLPPTPGAKSSVSPLFRVAAAGFAVAAIALAGRRVLALQARTWPVATVDGAEAAVVWNPDDLQARFSLAETYVQANQCEKARPHIAALLAMLPHHHQPRQLAAACRFTE